MPQRIRAVAVVAVVAAAWWTSPDLRPFVLTIAGLLLLITLHELGHFLAAKLTGVGTSEFSVGFGPKILSTRPREGRTLLTFRAIPLGGFVRIKGMGETDAPTDDPAPGRSYSEVSKPRQVLIASAGPAANIVVCVVLVFASFALIGPKVPTAEVAPVAGLPAAAAGVRTGDVIVAVGDIPTATWYDVTRAVGALDPAAQAPVQLTVRRGGELLEFELTPLAQDGRVVLGVNTVYATEPFSFSDSVDLTRRSLWAITTGTVTSLAEVGPSVLDMPGQIAGTSPPSENRLVSPVGLAQAADDVGEEAGAAGAVFMLGTVSFFLAVFNLLPIPPLDGGHILISTYEGLASRLRRREVTVNRERVGRLAAGVTVLLLVVGIGTILLDIVRPLGA